MIDESAKQVLGLELPTDPRWVNIAEKNIEEILIDHAFCEQKAASSCISLIIMYPEKEELVDMLTPVVAEEWSHFERVIEEMKKRGYKLGPQRKDEYVAKLMKVEKKGGSREQQLVEKLLINALIEARSCERFRLLWKYIPDEGLQKFYYELMVSEAGHYKNFLSLAKTYLPEDVVTKRWKEILVSEAEILKTLEVRGDRMH
ncbi:tRNA-(ms[2]io[6]A)-hydroxylase [Fulvivirga sediminis]|uniref:tRNA-(Ms[2]io[6]A)-hydroxylase n=1 Tax=Fulvivirga sediminis TaxID=2803949 RepID=A0A937F6P1_9BACT|nr:tRNA-(ms[2]io[6]A)-hydroxylase [Fulvivirga sediminis]MBL3655305.1 tRNA-(ms[2]io[6]A)-hydroxylase [Fulvivirga sediminis]